MLLVSLRQADRATPIPPTPRRAAKKPELMHHPEPQAEDSAWGSFLWLLQQFWWPGHICIMWYFDMTWKSAVRLVGLCARSASVELDDQMANGQIRLRQTWLFSPSVETVCAR